MEAILEPYREAVGEDYPEVLEAGFWDRVPTCEEGPEAYREAWEGRVREPGRAGEEALEGLRTRLVGEVAYLLERARQAGVAAADGPRRCGRAPPLLSPR